VPSLVVNMLNNFFLLAEGCPVKEAKHNINLFLEMPKYGVIGKGSVYCNECRVRVCDG